MMNLGDYAAGATVELKWNAFSGLGGSITRATNGSIRVYKGHSDTQRSSAAGITDTEDFDSLTGLNHVQIDLSDNTDAGFYAAGSEYQIVLQGAVIDGQTLNAVLAHFSIERGVKVASMAANVLTDTAIADSAFTAAKFAAACFTASKFGALAFDAVWSVATRVLTAGTNIALAKGTGVTGLNDLSAAQVNAEADAAIADAGLVAAVAALPSANANADALLDRTAGIETSRTLRQGLRLMLAALAGKASGLATTTATYRDTNDSKNRIVATVDADGNRSAVTLDAS